MKRLLFIVLIFFCAVPSSVAQLKIYSFEEAEKLSKENPKPIVVFIHTSWCKYCGMMENTTFKKPELITRLNANYYFVSMDAESTNDIVFNNHVFKFKPTGPNTGIHQLATELATIDNNVIYPTTVVLATDFSILFQKHSYLDDRTLLGILDKIK
ncbi:DUF255 domain-containing protein [Flavobacterium sp. GT3R68]|uniref:thioredoxin family protein n=1 Tax=Flavobacterium sp. GT3R68 TaxID=2594437 RepID=UPI000F88B769|nr:DUF255 domain-containing protein [Flavobacterium sp. GT3R68]RTY95996.1 DUF255 domain-containing protein [Flavobacterium sp. GSN2]TRW93769.1 DUF255 domain-containing protein [Flavobacterium sp. GT3R68]